jgi:hypothetical protein
MYINMPHLAITAVMSKAGAFTVQILQYYKFFCEESICGTFAGGDQSLDG